MVCFSKCFLVIINLQRSLYSQDAILILLNVSHEICQSLMRLVFVVAMPSLSCCYFSVMGWWIHFLWNSLVWHIDDLVQDYSNSIADALELLQICTKSSTCVIDNKYDKFRTVHKVWGINVLQYGGIVMCCSDWDVQLVSMKFVNVFFIKLWVMI